MTSHFSWKTHKFISALQKTSRSFSLILTQPNCLEAVTIALSISSSEYISSQGAKKTTACIHRRSCDRYNLIGSVGTLALAHRMLPIVSRHNILIITSWPMRLRSHYDITPVLSTLLLCRPLNLAISPESSI